MGSTQIFGFWSGNFNVEFFSNVSIFVRVFSLQNKAEKIEVSTNALTDTYVFSSILAAKRLILFTNK